MFPILVQVVAMNIRAINQDCWRRWLCHGWENGPRNRGGHRPKFGFKSGGSAVKFNLFIFDDGRMCSWIKRTTKNCNVFGLCSKSLWGDKWVRERYFRTLRKLGRCDNVPTVCIK